MLRDVEFFKTKLQHIDGFGDTGDYLMGIIKSKQVKSASPPPASETKTEKEKQAEGSDVGTDSKENREEKKDSEDSEAK